MTAIDSKYDALGEFELVDELVKLSNTDEPEAVKEIRTAPVRHDHVCAVDAMEGTVKKNGLELKQNNCEFIYVQDRLNVSTNYRNS